MKRRAIVQEYRVGTGASSLLMILVVLCLTTLAVLSMTGANADLRLTRRNAEMTAAYYAAETEYQSALSVLDGALLGTDAADVTQEFIAALGLTNCEAEISGDRLTLRLDAGFDRQLAAEIQIVPGEGGAAYRVLSHALTDVREWEGETLNVFF